MGIKETVMGFAEKVGDTVDKGIRTGSENYKKMSEKSKLKKEISQLDSELNGIYASVGRKLYNADPDNKEFAKIFGDISEKESELQLLKKELKILEESVPCKKCGELMPQDAEVCPNCGAKNAKQEAGSNVNVKARFCSSCGAELDAAARFCSKCGGKIE